MRVIHIIPSAFEYFDDIRSQAFQVLDALHKMGVDTEAFTLQYGQPTKRFKEGVKQDAPSIHDFKGNLGLDALVSSLKDFDIVHIHCPFLGAARKIINWKKANPSVPLVVTYYRDVKFEDMFSIFIKFYNFYFLPKIFAISSIIICQNFEYFNKSSGSNYMSDKNKLAVLDEIDLEQSTEKLSYSEDVASKTLLVYNTLVKS